MGAIAPRPTRAGPQTPADAKGGGVSRVHGGGVYPERRRNRAKVMMTDGTTARARERSEHAEGGGGRGREASPPGRGARGRGLGGGAEPPEEEGLRPPADKERGERSRSEPRGAKAPH